MRAKQRLVAPTLMSAGGVPSGQNDFAILPVLRHDHQIRAAADAIIYGHGIVDERGSSLVGRVASWRRPGPFSVQNDLDPWRSLWRE